MLLCYRCYIAPFWNIIIVLIPLLLRFKTTYMQCLCSNNLEGHLLKNRQDVITLNVIFAIKH